MARVFDWVTGEYYDDGTGDSGNTSATSPGVQAPDREISDEDMLINRNVWERDNRKAQPRDITTTSDASQAVGYDPDAAQRAHDAGNIGGATGAYNAGTDEAREWWNKNHKGGRHDGEQWWEVGNVADLPIMRAAFDAAKAQTYTPGTAPTLTLPEGGAATPEGGAATPEGGAATPGAATARRSPEEILAALGEDIPGLGGARAPQTQVATAAPQLNTSGANAGFQQASRGANLVEQAATRGLDTSVAQAQLRQSTADAQASALGLARSGNRRDRALLERQAIAEGAAIEGQAARQASVLRAQEEEARQRFAVDAGAKAAELGLNQAAAQIDISKVNLESTTNLINQQFEQLGIDKQLDQREAEAMLNFARDMAIVEKDYYALDQENQRAFVDQLLRQYDIDQRTYLGIEQLRAQGKIDWGAIAAGGGEAIVGAIGKALGL